MKWIFATGLCVGCLSSCSFTTSVHVSGERIKSNHGFSGGLAIRLLVVDSFNKNSIPVKYRVERRYIACTPTLLDVDEIAALLPAAIRRDYLYYEALKDSIIRHKINDTLPVGDTTKMAEGGIMYRPPGIHQSIQWYEAYNKIESIKFRHLKTRAPRKIWFNKNTRKYRWKESWGDNYLPRKGINGFSLIPNRWYSTRFDCRYGLLTSGTCTLYFFINNQGKMTVMRMDKKNDGLF
jgi:hypothetical protein